MIPAIHQRLRPRGLPFAMAAALAGTALALALFPMGPAGAQVSRGFVRGVVLNEATGRPVAGATVAIPELGARTTSGSDGSFAFGQALSTESPYRRIEVVVTAHGFGRWTIRGVPLSPADTLELRAELATSERTHDVLTPAERAASPAAAPSPTHTASGAAPPSPPRSSYTFTCTGWAYPQVAPQTIKVYLTQQKKSKTYDFLFYATHVLPNEWISSWDADALGAGAVAVKSWGAFRAQAGHAYSGGSGCADVTDYTADQVFDPTWSTAATTQAVYAAVGSTLLRDGKLFLTNYWSGAQDDKCAAVTGGTFAGWMSQWGSQNCAKQGKLWPVIDQVFYANTAWKYLRQLLQDPSADSAATYAWDWSGKVTRTQGSAYDGVYFFALVPQSGHDVVLRQRRPFLGTASTTYHSKVALRCLRANGGACKVTIAVLAIESNGTAHAKAKSVTEPRDGTWRLYGFDPAAFGLAHVQVELRVTTARSIDVDASFLTGPFGGP